MLRVTICIFTLCFSLISLAQRVPEKTSNNDLRVDNQVFSLSYYQDKDQKTFKFTTNKSGQYHLEHFHGEDLKSKRKIDSEKAQKIDDQFVDKFIAMKYMTEDKSPKKCKKEIKLNMRGEDFSVCTNDVVRNKEVEKLIKLLEENLI